MREGTSLDFSPAEEDLYAGRKEESRCMRYGSSTFVDSGPHSIYLYGGTSMRKIETSFKLPLRAAKN